MSDPLQSMDALFAEIDRLDELDPDELAQVATALDETSQELLREIQSGIPEPRRQAWRAHLERLLQHLPAAQEKVTAAQSLVARQLAAENRRVQRMRDEGKQFEGQRGLFQRNA